MAFQKFQADQLFTGTSLLQNDNVLIANETGTILEIVPEETAGDGIQKLKGTLCPGFINCHCHLELSHMKGLIPQKTGLIDFVFKVVTQRHFPDEEILDAIEKSEQEMMANGIVAVGDICNNTYTLQQKQKQHLHYYNFVEASGWLPEVAEARFRRSKAYYDEFVESVTKTSIVPHAPYSVSDNLWQQITAYFKNKTVSIHNQETSFEDELFLQGTGDFVRMYQMMKMDNSFYTPTKKSSLQTYFQKLATAASVILVHNTFTRKADITYAQSQAFLNKQLLSFCLCANANLYIENALPPVVLLRRTNSNIVIGTDSLASNHTLSVLDELKTIHQNFKTVPLEELLKWATLNGAKALQMEATLGSFETGKQPGIVLIDGIENENITATSSVKRIL